MVVFKGVVLIIQQEASGLALMQQVAAVRPKKKNGNHRENKKLSE